MADVKARVAGLPDNAAVIYVGLFTDGAGASFNPNDALQAIAAAANRPIVIDTETFIGAGGVGGPVTSLNRIGEDERDWPGGFSTARTYRAFPSAKQILSGRFSIGGSCNGSASMQADCRQEAKSSSVRQRHGSNTDGRSC